MADKFTKVADQDEGDWKKVTVDKEHKVVSTMTYAQLENRKANLEKRKARVAGLLAEVESEMELVESAAKE